MSNRAWRPDQIPEERLERWGLSRTPNSLRGESPNPFGIGQSSAALSALTGATESEGDHIAHYAEVLKAAGVNPATTYTTAHEPLPFWPHVWAGGVPCTPAVDFTQAGSTLTVLSAMDLQAAELLVCRYDYSPIGAVNPPLGLYLGEYPEVVVEDNPRFYYRMDAPFGILMTDVSGNGRNGTLVGPAAYQQPSLLPTDPNYSMTFFGVTYVDTPTTAGDYSSNAFTMEFWTSMGGAGTRNVYIWPGRIQLVVSGGRGIVYYWDGSGFAFWAQTDTSWTTGVCLNHITWDGTTLQFWKNGGPYNAATTSSVVLPAPTGDHMFGANGGNSGSGNLDEWAFYNHALTPLRIALHWSAGTT